MALSKYTKHRDMLLFAKALDYAYEDPGIKLYNSIHAIHNFHVVRYGLVLFNEQTCQLLGGAPLAGKEAINAVNWILHYDPYISSEYKTLAGTCYINQVIQFPNKPKDSYLIYPIHEKQLLSLPINWNNFLEHDITRVKIYPSSKPYKTEDILLALNGFTQNAGSLSPLNEVPNNN